MCNIHIIECMLKNEIKLTLLGYHVKIFSLEKCFTITKNNPWRKKKCHKSIINREGSMASNS